MEEDRMQQLRSKATVLLLREEWEESVLAYSQLISLCQDRISKTAHLPDLDLRKSLCLALSNRAEARFRLRLFAEALKDCEEALKVEGTHFKTLICKGKILLNLNRYDMALDCFKAALLDPQASGNSESLNVYLKKCKKLDFLSRTGSFDISDWVVNGFRGRSPEFAEYIGAVEIRKSEIRGRGLFATRNIDTGTLLLVTKAIATERVIMPESKLDDLGENAQLVVWKNFIETVVEAAEKCSRTNHLISQLSTGEDEEDLEVPDISLFRPGADDGNFLDEKKLEMARILTILDVNAQVENSISSIVLGKNSEYHAVGLWVLASFINHSCNPNVRRLHIGDYVMIHACRDVKAGEELTSAYFNVLSPLRNRQEMASNWGFRCKCKRCKFEETCPKQDLREIEVGLETGLDLGGVVYKLEEGMKRWTARGKGKGYLRASFYAAYSQVFESEKSMRRWGRRIPGLETVVDSVVDAVGSDERVLKTMKTRGSASRGGGGGVAEMERAMKVGRGMYGKVMKKQAMRTLLELSPHE